MTDAEKLDAIRALLTDRKFVYVDELLHILDQGEPLCPS